ncbi:MAG: serine/threonine-protein kinase [Planctomycetota bacterium]
MSESDLSNEQRSQLELLAEEYVELNRAGKAPSIDRFVAAHPELEDDIRDLFPVMLMLDQGKHLETAAETKVSGPAFPPDIVPGALLGDYKLDCVIGRGGMGLVYRAEHVHLGSRVAVKLLPSSLNRPKLQERFLREASAAARMNHPNIVRVFDYGQQGTTHYYVMSLVEGVGLDRVLSGSLDHESPEPDLVATTILSRYQELLHSDGLSSPPLKETTLFSEAQTPDESLSTSKKDTPGSQSTIAGESDFSVSDSWGSANSIWEWVATIGVQAADALAYAHEMGVIHRDIKPSNLMMNLHGKVVVTDFGLAKLQDDSSLTETGDLLGTLRYLPPEAIHGKADERGDIYGLGLTLYELLAGEPAFANVERAKLFHDISNGDVTPLHRKVPRIPRDLAQVIRKAIEPDLSLRYKSSAALRDDLHRYLRGEPIRARAASTTYRMRRWISRNIAITSLTVLIFLLLTAAATTATITASRFRDLAKQKASESESAVAARKESAEQTRIAKQNLFRSYLSDAKASASASIPGRAISGTQALRNAIGLSRELDVFEQHEDEIHSIAAVLATKHDIESESKWLNEQAIDRYDCLDFSGDLSEYAYIAGSAKARVCKIVSINTGVPVLVESIPIDGGPHGQSFSLSDDGRFVSAFLYQKEGGRDVISPWIYDRKLKQAKNLETPVLPWDFAEPVSPFHKSAKFAFLTDDRQVVVYDADLEKEALRTESLDFPADHLVVSPDDQYAAAFKEGSGNV